MNEVAIPEPDPSPQNSNRVLSPTDLSTRVFHLQSELKGSAARPKSAPYSRRVLTNKLADSSSTSRLDPVDRARNSNRPKSAVLPFSTFKKKDLYSSHAERLRSYIGEDDGLDKQLALLAKAMKPGSSMNADERHELGMNAHIAKSNSSTNLTARFTGSKIVNSKNQIVLSMKKGDSNNTSFDDNNQIKPFIGSNDECDNWVRRMCLDRKTRKVNELRHKNKVKQALNQWEDTKNKLELEYERKQKESSLILRANANFAEEKQDRKVMVYTEAGKLIEKSKVEIKKKKDRPASAKLNSRPWHFKNKVYSPKGRKGSKEQEVEVSVDNLETPLGAMANPYTDEEERPETDDVPKAASSSGASDTPVRLHLKETLLNNNNNQEHHSNNHSARSTASKMSTTSKASKASTFSKASKASNFTMRRTMTQRDPFAPTNLRHHSLRPMSAPISREDLQPHSQAAVDRFTKRAKSAGHRVSFSQRQQLAECELIREAFEKKGLTVPHRNTLINALVAPSVRNKDVILKNLPVSGYRLEPHPFARELTQFTQKKLKKKLKKKKKKKKKKSSVSPTKKKKIVKKKVKKSKKVE